MDCVCRTIWRLVYADDTFIVSLSLRRFDKMIEVIVEVSLASTGYTADDDASRSCGEYLPTGAIFCKLGNAVTGTLGKVSIDIARRNHAYRMSIRWYIH